MSTNFWANLLLSIVVLSLALVFIKRSKIKTIRYFLAERLRRKALPKLKAILAMIEASLQSSQADMFPLFRLRADLETLCLKGDVLFDEERLALSEFLAKLSSSMSILTVNTEAQIALDELVLSGQRAINELSESGRKS
ncbi:hypothetical protein N9060_01415 [Arenicella sp.]|nr:hypothetical protein [Arenicella sp.]